jgi:hypothetical protein
VQYSWIEGYVDCGELEIHMGREIKSHIGCRWKKIKECRKQICETDTGNQTYDHELQRQRFKN